MIYRGEFINDERKKIRVEIRTRGPLPVHILTAKGRHIRMPGGGRLSTSDKTAKEMPIGNDEEQLYFSAESAVEITVETNDIFDVAIRQSATIHLESASFISDFFRADPRESEVRIWREDAMIFRGMVLPMTLDQPFQEVIDSLDVNLIDCLSALEYYPYRRVMGDKGEVRSFREIIGAALNFVAPDMPIVATGVYDTDSTASHAEMLDAKINTSIFLGDEEEDDENMLTVVEGLLQYLNLHITQQGNSFRIFRWEDVKQCDTSEISSKTKIFYGTDNNISIGEIYNKISVEVKGDEKEDLLESPLENGDLTSPFANSQIYCREIYQMKDGGSWEALARLAIGESFPDVRNDETYMREWYIRVMEHPKWNFYGTGYQPVKWNGSLDVTKEDFYTQTFGTGDKTQWEYQNKLPDLLSNVVSGNGAALLRVGTAQTSYKKEEWNPPSRLNERTSMIINVGGRKSSHNSSSIGSMAEPQWAMPRAIYTGAEEGISLSPADDDTTRYIVFTGKVGLSPRIVTPNTWAHLRDVINQYKREHNGALPSDSVIRENSNWVASDEKERSMVREYLKQRTPSSGAETYLEPDNTTHLDMYDDEEADRLFKYTGYTNWYKWVYTDYGTGKPIGQLVWDVKEADTTRKVGILTCMLKIGDKVLCEKTGNGEIGDLVWEKFRTLQECGSMEEFLKQTFTLGIDPKNGDYLVGPSYDVANNVHYTMRIDEEGMAIPVRRSDGVSGKVQFAILGPCDIVFNEKKRITCDRFSFLLGKEPTEGEHIMEWVSAIWFDDFEIKILSDNAGIDPLEDVSLVYTSDTDDSFLNAHESSAFIVGSALTVEERRELGMKDEVRENTVMHPTTSEGVITVYDPITGDTAKPEQLYVDNYYRECSRPHISLTQSVWESEGEFFRTYTHQALPGKKFYPIAIERDLKSGSATLTLREVL